MVATDSTRDFEARIAYYDETGWEIRTINHAALRATVRFGATSAGNDSQGATAPAVAKTSVCRKLWVDSKGEVQETNVPC
jgi:hypothetical protein